MVVGAAVKKTSLLGAIPDICAVETGGRIDLEGPDEASCVVVVE